MQMNASCFHSAIQRRDAKGCRRTWPAQPTFSLPPLCLPSSFPSGRIASAPRHPGSRAAASQVTSVCANSSHKIHFQKVKSPQIFAWGRRVKPHVGHTHTHTRMWTHWADWQPVAPQSEVSQRTSWPSWAVTHAEIIDQPLSSETNCTSESEPETMRGEKNVPTLHKSSEIFSLYW